MTSKLKNIVQGWKNDTLKDPEIEALALDRSRHCAECPEAKKRKYFIWIKGDQVAKRGMVCALCGCPLKKKLRSPEEKCPQNKWHAVSSD